MLGSPPRLVMGSRGTTNPTSGGTETLLAARLASSSPRQPEEQPQSRRSAELIPRCGARSPKRSSRHWRRVVILGPARRRTDPQNRARVFGRFGIQCINRFSTLTRPARRCSGCVRGIRSVGELLAQRQRVPRTRQLYQSSCIRARATAGQPASRGAGRKEQHYECWSFPLCSSLI